MSALIVHVYMVILLIAIAFSNCMICNGCILYKYYHSRIMLLWWHDLTYVTTVIVHICHMHTM